MHDQALVWTTDRNLQVTSLTARLRGLAGIGIGSALHVSDLWGKDGPFNVATVAHHWALDGEHLAFEATVGSGTFRFELQPLEDLKGLTVGVAGRAVEIQQHSPLQSEALRHAERFAGMGTWHEDLRTGAVAISEGLAALLGIEQHAQAFDIRSFDHDEERGRIAQELAAQSGDEYVCDHRILAKDSRVRTVRERVRTLVDERGVALARIGTIIDISDLKDREAELSDLALHDALTGLPNRAAIEERLAQALQRAEQTERKCAVLFLDLDDFKALNDAHGHHFGDAVLASVAQRLTRNVRATDTVGRIGGDEFVVLVEDVYTDAAALDAARKLLRSFDEPLLVEDRPVYVNASVGVATYPNAGKNVRALLQAADREMYIVKRNGGSGAKIAAPQEETSVRIDEKPSCPVRYSRDHRHFATRESA